MSFQTQTVTYDQVFTRFAYNKIGGSKYKDNKYKDRPLLQLLNERKLTGSGGGQQIVHPVNLGTSANGKSLSRNETFSITGDVNETVSRYSWAVVIETCFVSWWDTRETDGNDQKMEKLLDTRTDETKENMNDNLATMIAQSSAAVATDINPLLSIVATSGATGGLNPSTAGQTTWASETEGTIDWSVEGVGRSRQLKRKLNDNKGHPDVLLLPSAFWEETCEIGDAATVINQDIATRGGTKYASLGAQVPVVLGMPVIHDPAWDTAQSATGLMLDLSGTHLVVDPKWDMYMWPFKEMTWFGRLGWATVQVEVAQLTCSARRTSGSLTTIS
jgi:hypothetical protein